MRKYRNLQFFLIACLLVFTCFGCSSLTSLKHSVFGKNSQKQAQISAKFARLDKEEAQINHERLTSIGAWSMGTEKALNSTTNDEPAVEIAKETNARVIALAEKPDYKELQAVYSIVNTYLTNQTKAETMLREKDKIINDIYQRIKDTEQDKEIEIAKAKAQALAAASEADQYKATLKQIDGNGGLNAIVYGVKKLVVRCAWILGIGSAVFIILRIFASANPIAGALFSVFDLMGSWVVNTIKVIFPKALTMAGTVSKDVYNASSQLLAKIVDSVEWVKKTEQATGKPMTIKDLLDELDKTMDASEKTQISNLKKQLGYI